MTAATWLPKAPTLAEIFDHVIYELDLDRAAFFGPCRRADLVLARQAAVWLARRRTAKSFPQIGRHVGGRDHSTIRHALGRAVERRGCDLHFRQALDRLDALLGEPE